MAALVVTVEAAMVTVEEEMVEAAMVTVDAATDSPERHPVRWRGWSDASTMKLIEPCRGHTRASALSFVFV